MEYLDYSLEDFLADERFQQWALYPDQTNSQFWVNWLQENPGKQPLVNKARQMLKMMAFNESPAIEESRIENLWKRIETSRNQALPAFTVALPKSAQMGLTSRYKGMAAVFVVLLAGTIVFYVLFKPAALIEQRTVYGQTRTIVLPDQSTIMLNSNSSIRYAAEWDTDEPRQVWVEGEAYFSVVHTQNHQKFCVTTTAGMAVEVLGTQFNVKNRKSGTQVVLQSGKVKLLIQQNNKKKQQVMMEPSESVELAKTATGYVKKRVDPQQYLSWTQHKLIFKNTPIAEIKNLLEETYGLRVSIPDTNLLSQRISGSVPSNSIESVLFVLSESFNYKIIKENNQLLFLERNTK